MANLVEQILENYANKLIDALKDNLNAKGKYGRGTFAQSIIALPVKVLGGNYVMEIQMDEYWKFIDEGVDGWETSQGSKYKYKKNGKPIPVSAMKRTIATNGISTGGMQQFYKNKQGLKVKRKNPLSKDKALDSLAWAIGYGVKRKGLKKTNFAKEVFEGQIVKDMSKAIFEAVGKEIRIEIRNEIKDGNNNK